MPQNGEVGQKDANPKRGPEVAGSIFPLTNGFFWVPGIFDPHPYEEKHGKTQKETCCFCRLLKENIGATPGPSAELLPGFSQYLETTS